MRTTLDIAEDVLLAAKELARRERSTVGAVISRLARQSLVAGDRPAPTAERLARLGIRALPHRGGIIANASVDRIRDNEGI